MLAKYGPWAVITGASAGIGAEYARHLSSLGLSVALVARREGPLQALASELPTATRTICADLSTASGISAVISGVSDLDVGVLVNNAGMESHGSFLQHDTATHERMITLNVTSVTLLAHAFGKKMLKERAGRRGAMLFVSSVAKDGLPWFTTYSASKAYVSMMAYNLREEWRGAIDVVAVEPGAVATDMFSEDLQKLKWKTVTASTVAQDSVKALEDGRFRVTPGRPNDEESDRKIGGDIVNSGKKMRDAWPEDRFDHFKA